MRISRPWRARINTYRVFASTLSEPNTDNGGRRRIHPVPETISVCWPEGANQQNQQRSTFATRRGQDKNKCMHNRWVNIVGTKAAETDCRHYFPLYSVHKECVADANASAIMDAKLNRTRVFLCANIARKRESLGAIFLRRPSCQIRPPFDSKHRVRMTPIRRVQSKQ